jgi:hypothetical protein
MQVVKINIKIAPTRFGVNPLTPELNPSAQRCLTIIFIRDFVS